MKSTRRGFLKAAAVGAGALALSPVTAMASSKAPSFGPNEVGMLYDSTLCVGCKACVFACRSANYDGLPDSVLSPADEAESRWHNPMGLDYRTKNIIKLYQNPDDKMDFAFIKRQCMHCNHPGCVSACPVKAMVKNPDTGIVEYYANICIGCRYCQIACPFNVPTFEWHRALPKISKCELCRESTLATKGTTSCVDVCPVKAVIFGKRSDLLAEAQSRLANNPNKYVNKIYGETTYGGTNVIYLSRVDFELLGMPNLPDYSYAAKSENLQHTIYKYGIAPIALYGFLAFMAVRNSKKHHSDDGKQGDKHE